LNSLQIHDRVLTPEQVSALGRPTADGVPFFTGSAIAQWDFNGSLASSSGGSNLVALATAPAGVPAVAFTTATIGGQTAQVASFSRGTCFRMVHGLGVNGGGAFLNRYTLLMDVMFPSRPTGWAVLYQTSPANDNDGDWFIEPGGGIGISSNYGGSVPDGTWNRLALADRSYDALKGADALAVVTEWNEFREPDFARMRKLLRSPVIFDGRNIYRPAMMKEQGFTYYAIGR